MSKIKNYHFSFTNKKLFSIVLLCSSITTQGLVLLPPTMSQELREGGMSFKSLNRDNLRMSSSSVSGLRTGGSAEATGGSINVGSASSDVISVLNPILNSTGVTGDLFVAGDRQLWVPTLLLQRDLPIARAVNPTKSVSRGAIDPAFKDMLINAATESAKSLNLVEEFSLANTDDPSKPYTKVQFSETYDQLQQYVSSKDSNNKLITNGLHIFSLSSNPEPASQLLSTRDLQLKARDKSVNPTAKAWQSDQVIDANLVYLGHDSLDLNQNKIEISNTQGSGSTQTHSRFSILGFSTNLNPNEGKTSQLSAFASNNSTVGSIRAEPNQTLEDIAAKYGTTVEVLRQVNNLPDTVKDIAGLKIVIPADLSTVGFYEVIPGDTLTNVANLYGLNVSWLMDLNGISDPGLVLEAGKKLQIPGLKPIGSVVLPPAKPLEAALEYADYGAYTAFQVTYYVKGALTPLFEKTFFNTLR